LGENFKVLFVDRIHTVREEAGNVQINMILLVPVLSVWNVIDQGSQIKQEISSQTRGATARTA
jgi:hypothetical protein